MDFSKHDEVRTIVGAPDVELIRICCSRGLKSGRCANSIAVLGSDVRRRKPAPSKALFPNSLGSFRLMTESLSPADGSRPNSVTDLLIRLRDGETAAVSNLLPHVYAELKAIAQRQMRNERGDHTLQPTALVHEAFLRLVDQSTMDCNGRTHFLCVSAKAMRGVLVDHARARNRLKRGGGVELLSLDDSPVPVRMPLLDLVALDVALSRLAEAHPRQAEVVEMMHFGGLTIEEVAAVFEISRRTVLRDWRYARSWLMQAITNEQSTASRAFPGV